MKDMNMHKERAKFRVIATIAIIMIIIGVIYCTYTIKTNKQEMQAALMITAHPEVSVMEIPEPPSIEVEEIEKTEPVLEEPSFDVTVLTDFQINAILSNHMYEDLDNYVWFKDYFTYDVSYFVDEYRIIPETNALAVTFSIADTDAIMGSVYCEDGWHDGYFYNKYDEDFPIIQFAQIVPDTTYEFYEYVHNFTKSRFMTTEWACQRYMELVGEDVDQTLTIDVSTFFEVESSDYELWD